MERLHSRYGHFGNSHKYSHQLKVCKNLCKRLKEDDYTSPYAERNKPHFEWFSELFDKSMNEETESDENGMRLIMRHNEPDEPESRWIRPAYDHEDYLAKQDLELMCNIIRKHAQYWWD
jgi:hypothetical protein